MEDKIKAFFLIIARTDFGEIMLIYQNIQCGKYIDKFKQSRLIIKTQETCSHTVKVSINMYV